MSKNTLTTDDARDQHGNPTGLLEQANDVFEDMVTLRRDLHEWPEVSNYLPRTRERVLALTAALRASWGCSWERRHFVLARQRCLGGTKRLPAKRFTGAPSRALPPPLDDVW
jgi:hypothetical protein